MTEGWLPPEAPGGQVPGRWDRPEAPRPAAPPDPGTRPTSVTPPATDQSNGAAVAALVLSLSGLVLLLGSAGLMAVVSLPLSVGAWVAGVKGRARADRGEAGQRELAQAGWLMGIIGTLLGAVALIGWILFVALSDGFMDDLRDELEQRGYTVEATLGAALIGRAAAGL